MKHTIDIEGLPEGYEVSEVELKTKHVWRENEIFAIDAVIHLKKKQPRRIVLEETAEDNKSGVLGPNTQQFGDVYIVNQKKIWRIVEDSGENND